MSDNNIIVRAPNRTCSNEIRRLVIYNSVKNHMNTNNIASNFMISKKTVQRILTRYHETNETDKHKVGGNKPCK
jgi:transposase